jgi:hypothetical protein
MSLNMSLFFQREPIPSKVSPELYLCGYLKDTVSKMKPPSSPGPQSGRTKKQHMLRDVPQRGKTTRTAGILSAFGQDGKDLVFLL